MRRWESSMPSVVPRVRQDSHIERYEGDVPITAAVRHVTEPVLETLKHGLDDVARVVGEPRRKSAALAVHPRARHTQNARDLAPRVRTLPENQPVRNAVLGQPLEIHIQRVVGRHRPGVPGARGGKWKSERAQDEPKYATDDVAFHSYERSLTSAPACSSRPRR